MRRLFLTCIALVLGAMGMMGCGNSDEAAAAATPKPKQPDATAADRANQINENPNISPDVKKVIGGGGTSKGL